MYSLFLPCLFIGFIYYTCSSLFTIYLFTNLYTFCYFFILFFYFHLFMSYFLMSFCEVLLLWLPHVPRQA